MVRPRTSRVKTGVGTILRNQRVRMGAETGTTPPPVVTFNILTEDGNNIITENGNNMVTENAT